MRTSGAADERNSKRRGWDSNPRNLSARRFARSGMPAIAGNDVQQPARQTQFSAAGSARRDASRCTRIGKPSRVVLGSSDGQQAGASEPLTAMPNRFSCFACCGTQSRGTGPPRGPELGRHPSYRRTMGHTGKTLRSDTTCRKGSRRRTQMHRTEPPRSYRHRPSRRQTARPRNRPSHPDRSRHKNPLRPRRRTAAARSGPTPRTHSGRKTYRRILHTSPRRRSYNHRRARSSRSDRPDR